MQGIYRLETLLESAIDKHFDLFEIYVLRNTFALKTELIPYMALTHQVRPSPPSLPGPATEREAIQVSLDENLRGKDGEALEEYEQELRLYEEELRKERELACADEFVKRKLDSAQELAEEVGYMRGAGASPSPARCILLTDATADPLSSRTQGLVSQLSLLQERLATLLATPPPPAHRATTDQADPWASSRASFVNWAAASKVDALPAGARDPTAVVTEDAVIKQMTETMDATGRDDDAQVSSSRVRVGSLR